MGREAGFTLIEMSLVLVIIGLIVGGILVGADLIKGAEIRAAVSQVEKYSTAANTFKLKYKYLPGDIPGYIAARYGMFQMSIAGPGFGDGDGMLMGLCYLESFMFWRHLTDVGMADGSYGVNWPSRIDPANGHPSATVMNFHESFPHSKLGRNNYVLAVDGTLSGHRMNTFYILGLRAHGPLVCTTARGITPIEAHEFDQKVDDGKPVTGKVQVAADSWSAFPTSGICMFGGVDRYDPTAAYNLSGDFGNTPACQLQVGFN